jgi:hypothetical protein
MQTLLCLITVSSGIRTIRIIRTLASHWLEKVSNSMPPVWIIDQSDAAVFFLGNCLQCLTQGLFGILVQVGFFFENELKYVMLVAVSLR